VALALLVAAASGCGTDDGSTVDDAGPAPTLGGDTASTGDGDTDHDGTATATGPDTAPGGPVGSHPTLPPAGPDAGATGDPDGTAEADGSGAAPTDAPFPRSAAELAAALTEAEEAIRRPELGPDEVAAWGRRQQTLYRILGAHPAWYEEVTASVPSPLGEVVTLNWTARQALNALQATEPVHDTLPSWRIDEPRPADELLGYYRDAAAATGVPWSVLAAINLVETRMGRINGISTAGALGPMQFLPTTWAECCTGDPHDERDAIRGAAEYLIDRGAARDLDRAIWGYNNSDHYVTAVRSYATVLDLDERAYAGYHAWEVFFLTTEGLVWLPVGYEEGAEVDAATWLAANPGHLITIDGPTEG
jgi:hypothetical protein